MVLLFGRPPKYCSAAADLSQRAANDLVLAINRRS